jgi:hypothetical protein
MLADIFMMLQLVGKSRWKFLATPACRERIPQICYLDYFCLLGGGPKFFLLTDYPPLHFGTIFLLRAGISAIRAGHHEAQRSCHIGLPGS